MSLANKFRWFPTPGYGVCGGKHKDCTLDPMDKLFYQHDNDLDKAHKIVDPFEQALAEREADRMLYDGLKALNEDDFKKIPSFTWKFPFFKRWYAKTYRKNALKVFRP